MTGSKFELGGRKPVFGFIMLGGPLTGALVRDIRLANELSRRGFTVQVWWAIDRPKRSGLRPEIKQHWLFSGVRYASAGPFGLPWGLRDRIGRVGTALFPESFWVGQVQRRPWATESIGRGIIRRICEGVAADSGLIRRFARELRAAGVTHVHPIEIFAPWALAAREVAGHSFGVAVALQGYEVCLNYARMIGCEGRFIERLHEMAADGDWPIIAMSQFYRDRAVRELGMPGSSFRVVHPGVPRPEGIERAEAVRIVSGMFPTFKPEVKLVTYLGRRDAEKGLDLLIYAAALLRKRGVEHQLAVVGPTLHGSNYVESCRLIAQNLRLPVLWQGMVSQRERDALYAASRVVAYPSIHGEPFGMVPVEAMSFGTPAVVPDLGGIAEVVEANGLTGGLRFRAHDTGSLAEAIGKLLTDDGLWRNCSEAGPRVAATYSVEKMADRILAHMGLPPQP